MAEGRKFVIMVTHGPDNPEMATIPFVMAGAAASADVEVVMGFQGEGVMLVKCGVAETVTAPEFKPLADLLNTIREFGGTFLVVRPVHQEPRDPRGRPRRRAPTSSPRAVSWPRSRPRPTRSSTRRSE